MCFSLHAGAYDGGALTLSHTVLNSSHCRRFAFKSNKLSIKMSNNSFSRHQGYHRPLDSQPSTARRGDRSKEPGSNVYVFQRDPQASEQTLPPLSTDNSSERTKHTSPSFISPSIAKTSSFGWVLETIACLGSLVSFAGEFKSPNIELNPDGQSTQAIIVVLQLRDQKTLPDWPLHITLNTFLAICTTFSKACFMISLAESISQWKWNMYCDTSHGRPLGDFHILDLASRGFWGSCRLIGRLHWRLVCDLDCPY